MFSKLSISLVLLICKIAPHFHLCHSTKYSSEIYSKAVAFILFSLYYLNNSAILSYWYVPFSDQYLYFALHLEPIMKLPIAIAEPVVGKLNLKYHRDYYLCLILLSLSNTFSSTIYSFQGRSLFQMNLESHIEMKTTNIH